MTELLDRAVSDQPLIDVARRRALVHPERLAFRFLADGEVEEGSLTYAELDRRARALGAFLQEAGLAGERALLLYPPGLEFVTAFLGCLYGGVVAVPAYPPRANRPDPRLLAIVEDARPRLALTTPAIAGRAAASAARVPGLSEVRWVATEEIDPALAGRWRPWEVPLEAPAFLQYTSGSTSTPKGVVVRHGNLAHNERSIETAFGMTEGSVAVGWLPLYHDMGLIGNVLQPLYVGATCTLMSPVAFLQRPMRWLEAISRYRATTSGGPNFAYELAVRKSSPEERERLDLSSWELAFSGAEPVRAETLERFAEAFAPCGFRREAFYPCYGLAEATLFVSGPGRGGVPEVRDIDAEALERHRAEPARPGAPARRLVGCGVSWLDQRVVVVDPETARPRAEGEVGEIWVAGPSVAGGYWNRPEETARTFAARLATEPESGPFLRTGDLGFALDGELYVSGRMKDLIIVRGRNLYPQDVELTVERSHPALRPGCGAAFAVEVDGEERLVLVQEVERDAERRLAKEPGALEAVADAVRRAVAEEHEVAVHAVVLLRTGSVPKTSSGKIRRQSCKADFLAGGLEAVGEWRRDAERGDGVTPRTPTEERLERIWAEVLELGRVSVEEDLLALGADSLKATQLLARVNDSFGAALSLETLFAAPTIAALAALLDGTEAPVLGAPPILPAPRDGDLPLSFAQRRLWFLHQLEPDNPVHNIAAAVRIEGALDAPALARALSEIVRRHEALRTAFAVSGDEPAQVIRPAEPLALPCEDLSALPAAAREAAARDAARAVARLPFDIERGPFLRALLVRLGAREHDLVLSLHHIAADGGSLAVLVRELGALYAAFAAGRPSPLPEPEVQYADFARWQREWLTEETLAPGIAFWRERLGGERPALELPTDRPRPAVLSFRGAHVERLVPAPLVARLEELARGAGATLFMTLLAGFEGLLNRVTGAEDLVVGSPIAGRTRVELEGLIGVFINNLVLRTSAAGEPTFRELLARVRETALAAYAHQEVPFERLVDELQPERDLSRSPLFQVMFVGQNAPLGRLELPGLALAPREVDLGIARFDLSLSMGEADGGWLGTWKFSTDLFDPATMHRLARHLEALLAAAAAEPDRPVARLPLLDRAERHQVVAGWNDTRVERHEGVTLQQLIAAQVVHTPNAIAVEDSQERITYAELGARARHLAARLRTLGVGPGSLVGIAAERSVGMVAGLVGILEAGGAYVPLDPSYPADRLAYMLEDSKIEVLLTQSHVQPNLPALPLRADRVLLLDDPTLWEPQAKDGPTAAGPSEDGAQLSEAAGRVREHRPEPAPPPATAPAYMIYTSGSTGRPKGAAVPHQGIVNRLLWMQEAYDLTPADTVLQKTPYSFDVSVWELFWPLVTGARLVMAPPGAHQDAARLAGLIRDHGVTTLHFVPSMLQVFLEQEGLGGACANVRRVFASGEALPFELKERFLDRLPGVELHNLYGPTEASVDVTYHACTSGGRRRTVPIGRPIANTSILLFDRHLEPVPVGIPGELHIGGVGLAIGYLGRPELTAERFIPDPTSGIPGARLYKTGDLARFRPDGEVEFLGRLDHQVKIRGVRIELGEIEAALAAHAGVRETVVLARRDHGADARLVAYLVPSGEAPAASELRGWLRERLPEAMVPSAFVALPTFPLTPSGKVDRRALPAPEPERPVEGAGYVTPRTPLEARLAAIWSELLKVERIGVHDDFFELGGDSIQGAMLVNRLQKELGQIVYVMALFDAPTIAELADYLTGSYPEAAARLGGGAVEAQGSTARSHRNSAETEAALAGLAAAVARRLGREAGAVPATPGVARRLPPAVFLLSPFRSGSTLLRVMLAGHPRLFAPPELELLAFETMGERARVYSGRNRFAVEGLLRAVMELEGCDAERAREIVGAAEAADEPVAGFYARLQGAIGDRLLVDKTPSYALDLPTLRRAERLFEGARYVHLVRHPRATIDSYLEAKMDRVYDFPFPPEEQAELVWLLGHRNVLSFLAEVPAERQHRLHFEDLVKAPREAMAELCAFLGLELEEAMLAPYEGRRMTDGLHAGTRMMGDPKFHQHQGIDASVADRWREGGGDLGEAARELAATLGYEAPAVLAETTEDDVLELRPAPRDAEPVLSFAQERLWFLSQLDPENPSYNMPAAVLLEGRLDVAALAASFAEVRRRHQVLRTVFPSVKGQPSPRVLPADAASALPVVDLASLPATEREAERRRLALAEGRRPFDLARGPMLRTTLLRLGAAEHVLLATMHHIASDGWTIGILVRELEALYGAFSQGRPSRQSPVPELPLQYADYAYWQRRWLAGPAMERHLAYWRRRLAGRLPALELPTDRPRPALLTARGARLSRTVPKVDLEEARAWSQRQGVTLFLTLLSAFDALLHRWTGQEDLLLGIPIANRTRVEVEGLIGFFLNMTVERADASGDPAFRELLSRVRDGFLGSTPHQEVPFEKLVEDLQPERDLSRTPIFQVQFSLQNTPGQPLELPGLTLTLLENHNRTTKFDMTVFLFDEPEGLRTTLEYNADLFDEATIARLLAHWETLLTGAVAAPGRRLSELPMLTAAERRQLFAEWNTPDASFAAAPALHRLFERQAALRPNDVAVVYEVEELTYRRLNERANRLARRLCALGVGPEVPVGLCVERSVDLIVGLLGILKAGGAYVPLDPAYPPERLAYILGDALAGSAAPVLVTQERLVARFRPEGEEAAADHRGYRIVRLDADRASLARESAEDLPEEVDADHLAYVIYTSGSTGRPKGVPVPHSNVVRLFEATRRWFDFGPADVWTMFHSSAFDFSVWEVWGALLHGGRLVVVPREAAIAPALFHELLVTEKVTVLNQTPSAFRQLIRADEEEGGRGRLALRSVIFGGEALDLAALAPWVERHGDERPALINMYGITETTVHVTYRRITAADLERPGVSPVGVPIPDLQVHLLGRHLEPLPVGVPGEIHVGGAGLARGYLNRPELSAERFIPDPFSTRPGARLYRSGDLARRRPDGELDYLGRIDGQVKIRGFRIELGEIEAALNRHPRVRESVVMARPDSTGGRRLVAWIVARGADHPSVHELREHLGTTLPEYMVPAAFVTLDRLPLTGNGKVDRRALPEPGDHRPDLGAAVVAPRTPTEARLAAVWREVLRLDEVGVDDDFFELGGHSLLVAQLASRVLARFGVELPLRTVFEAPTLAAMAARLEGLLPEGGAAVEPALEIPRADRSGDLPLSFAQERLWFLDQLEPGSPLYNVPVPLRLHGRLSVPAFAGAFREIVRRHEALRTSFRAVDGTPVQVVEPEPAFEVPYTDISMLPEGERDAALARLAEDEARAPFDLGKAPLVRARLVRLAEAEHAALVTLHHIVSDGWSMGVLVREVAALYRAQIEDQIEEQPAPLPELPVQYADYAVWQRQRLADEALEAELAHWRSELAGAALVLDLPTDRPRPPVQGFRGRHLPVAIPKPLLERVKALGLADGATLFMTLLAAFQALLHRYTGQEGFLVGSPVANRTRREVEDLIGFFVNTLALRADVSGAPAFRELVGRVRERTLAAQAHQDLPFERLVEALEPQRDLSRAPLFQVLFVLQNAPLGPLGLPGLMVEPLPVESGTSKFDLTLSLMETADGLGGFLEYATDLFEEATARRLLAHFENLLESAVAEPERPVAELALLGEAERRQLLVGWNETRVERPRGTLVHELVAAQAARTPERPAVSFGGETLSYRELDERSNRLAHHLRRLGAGPEALVGLCVERSAAMVVGLLGVLKSGAAYVPLDPNHPAERLALVLEGARPAVLVTEERLLAGLAPQGTEVVCLDRDREAIAAASAAPLPRLTDDEGLAYVIYTSGSTGRPKGVQLPHRAVVNFLRAMAERPGLGAADVVPALTTLSFDIAGLEIYLPLMVGARVEVVTREEAADGRLLAGRLAASGVTVMQATPATWRLLVESGWEGRPDLEALCGGEALPRELADELLARGVELWNVYGPTETAIWSAAGEVVPGSGPVRLGRAIDNTRFYVVDRRFEPVPVGVAGELWIAGDGVARGYLGRPELTAEKFVPDPFGVFSGSSSEPEPGARLYRTGDLVRWRDGGELEFLGRIDHQVKVRGYRIELGEIEAALCQHPAVAQAVVVTRGEAAGTRLVAYLVAREGEAAPSTTELRAHLGAILPEYMVPAAFVALPALPLNPSGKVDRKALPEPERAAESAGSVAPRDPVEEVIAGIWSELLGVERIGVEDDFFELGGHSLLATRLASRLRGAFGVELPVRRLFEARTVAALAEVLRTARRGEALPPIRPVPRDRELPLSFAQERLWFVDQLEPGDALYNLPAAVRLSGRLDTAALVVSLDELVRRHEALRTTFVARGGKPVQVIHPPAPMPLERIDLSHLAPDEAEAEARRRATAEAVQPFDLATGPLVRAALLRLAADDHVLLLTMHHIVSDGWSMGVLLGEVAALYGAFAQGRPSPLPELPIQYPDFAVWQRGWLQGEALAAQLGYWTERLAGSSPLRLPVDRQPASEEELRAADLPFRVPAELTRGLKALGRQRGASLFMTLLAGFQALLARHTGQEDVAVGSPVAGRNRAEIEPLIGLFINTLVLRTDAGGDPTFGELLARVREATLGAYDHQDLPFARLVEALRPERHLGSYPLVEVLFALQNQPIPAVELPELTMRPMPRGEVEDVRTSFSLALRLWEDGDGLAGGFGYNSALFDRSTLERWRDRLLALLAAAVEDPERRLSELLPLPEAERRQVLAPAATAKPVAAAVATPAPPAVVESIDRERAELASRRESLSEAKRELLARRLRGLAGGGAPAAGAPAARPSAPSILVKLQEGQTGRRPFFCVHAIGGTVFSYGELARAVGPERPFWGVQAPGLEDGAEPLRDVVAMAAAYVDAIRAVEPAGPYLLGGWSFGGVVAFEMARQLRAQGREVGLLALVDSWAPVRMEVPTDRDELDLLRGFLRDQAGMLGSDAAWIDEPPPAGLPAAERSLWLLGRAREAGLLQAEVKPERVRRLLAVYRANLEAYASYRPEPWHAAITLYRPEVTLHQPTPRPANGWEELSSGPIEVHAVPGDHYTMLTAPGVLLLAKLLERHLERAAGEVPDEVRARRG